MRFRDAVLLYGDLLIEMLKDLNIWTSLSNYAVVGNYRLRFYQKYRSFYDSLVVKEVSLDKKKRTLLYAPTWRDADGAASFFQYGKRSFLSYLPTGILYKSEPLAEEQRDPAHFYALAAQMDKKPSAILSMNFLPSTRFFLYPICILETPLPSATIFSISNGLSIFSRENKRASSTRAAG